MIFPKTKLYSVYVKKDSKNPLDTAIFIKQGFNFWAFIFTPIWALYNRLWFTFLILVTLSVLLAMNDGIEFSITSLVLSAWFGFEANSFRANRLERKGYIVYDVVTGIDTVSAQTRFYDKYLVTKNAQVKTSSFGFAN